jgi:hypothetical protein
MKIIKNFISRDIIVLVIPLKINPDIPSCLSMMSTGIKIPRRLMFANEFLKYVTLN